MIVVKSDLLLVTMRSTPQRTGNQHWSQLSCLYWLQLSVAKEWRLFGLAGESTAKLHIRGSWVRPRLRTLHAADVVGRRFLSVSGDQRLRHGHVERDVSTASSAGLLRWSGDRREERLDWGSAVQAGVQADQVGPSANLLVEHCRWSLRQVTDSHCHWQSCTDRWRRYV